MGRKSKVAGILALFTAVTTMPLRALAVTSSGVTVSAIPTIIDPNTTNRSAPFNLLVYSSPLSGPAGAVFVGKDQALVAQKNNGKILFLEGGELSSTVLDLPVANRGSQGIVDIAISPKFSRDGYVYVYSTPAKKDGATSGAKVLSRYHWDKNKQTLKFDKTISSDAKSPKAASVSGVISFDSKGRVSIAPVNQAGPAVVSANFSLNSVNSSMRLFHPANAMDGRTVVGMVSSSALSKAGSGTLQLSPGSLQLNTLSAQQSIPSVFNLPGSAKIKAGDSFANGTIKGSLYTSPLNYSITPPVITPPVIVTPPVTPIVVPIPQPIIPPIINVGTIGSAGGTLVLGGNISPINPIIGSGTTTTGGSGTLTDNTGVVTGAIDIGDQLVPPPILNPPDGGTITIGAGTNSSGTLSLGGATIDLSGAIAAFNQGTLTLPSISIPPNPDPAAGGTASLEAPPTVVPTSLQVTVTPEPGSLALGILGLSATLLRRRARS